MRSATIGRLWGHFFRGTSVAESPRRPTKTAAWKLQVADRVLAQGTRTHYARRVAKVASISLRDTEGHTLARVPLTLSCEVLSVVSEGNGSSLPSIPPYQRE